MPFCLCQLALASNLCIGGIQVEAFAKAVRDSPKDALADFANTAQEASVRATSELDSKTEKAPLSLSKTFCCNT